MTIEEGTFARVFRGYDTTEVDKAVTRLRRELMLAKTELDKQRIAIADLTEQVDTLTTNLQQVGKPTFSGLGKALVTTLSTAEKQASALVTQATADAYNIKLAGDRERERAVAETEALARDIMVNAQQDADDVAKQAQAEAEKLIRDAENRAKNILVEAERTATDVHRRAMTEVSRERADAARQVEYGRAETERELAELRLVTAAQIKKSNKAAISDQVLELLRLDANHAVDHEEQERELLRKHADAVIGTQKYLDDAQHQVQALNARKLELIRETDELTATTNEQLASLRRAVDERAMEILSQANAESAATIALAKDRARDLVAGAEKQLESLNSQREILSKHLDAIKSVITEATEVTAAPAAPPKKPRVTRARKPTSPTQG